MKTALDQVNETLDTAGRIADDLLESGEERQEQLTHRHELDMINGTWLTKNIRPLTLLALLGYWVVLIPVLKSFGVTIDESVINAVEMLSLAAFTFYFGGKSFEKVQVIKTKGERKEARQQRRLERIKTRKGIE